MPVESVASAFQVHASDNVATLLREAAAGAPLEIVGPARGQDLTAREKIELGHKVALTAIPEGASVTKFGVVIGIAMRPIEARRVGASPQLPQPAGRAVGLVRSPNRCAGGQRLCLITGAGGYLRQDGRKGIRNHLLVVYTVECASFVAQEIAQDEPDTHVIGFPGCYDNDYAIRLMLALATHPNIGGVLCCGPWLRVHAAASHRRGGAPVRPAGGVVFHSGARRHARAVSHWARR